MAFKFCPECGFKFDKEYKFCPECGYSLNGEQPKEKAKNTESLFDFSEDTAIFEAGFDRQLEELSKKEAAKQSASEIEGKLKKAFSLCLRGMFEKAMKLYDEVLDEDDLNLEALIGIVCASSENYENDYPNAERDIRAVIKVAGGINKVVDEDFKNYVSQRQTKIKKAAEEVSNKKATKDEAEVGLKKVNEAAQNNVELKKELPRTLFDKDYFEEMLKPLSSQSETKRKKAAEQAAKKRAKEAAMKKVAEEEAARKKAAEEEEKKTSEEKRERARKLYAEKNYNDAFPLCLEFAEMGEAEFQHKAGYCYEMGYGVKQNNKKAVELYKKSAEQGNVAGQINLGFCYNFGQGVTQSNEEAVKWYKKAAEQGNAVGQINLGICYYSGKGVTQSNEEAVKWFKKSAEQGYAKAQYNLGFCYFNGKGVTQSYEEAVKWYKKSAEQGDAMAQNNLGLCYRDGLGVTRSITEAKRWLQKAAEQGHSDAKDTLKGL